MAPNAHSTHLPAFAEPHTREEIGNQLQMLLVELIDLSLLGKQLHWTVVGPLFHPLHTHLDELIDWWRELSDTVAERAVAIGFIPDGQSATISSETPLRAIERGELEDHLVVRELTSRLAEVPAHMRE